MPKFYMRTFASRVNGNIKNTKFPTEAPSIGNFVFWP